MTPEIHCDVCIVGAGPAGMMAAVKLCSYGLKVVLLERSPSFPAAREFRGESISQQSIALFDGIGVLKSLEKYNYLKTERLEVVQGGKLLLHIDFTTMGFQHKCPIDIPQPILLAEMLELLQGRENFTFIKGATCTALLKDGDEINGVQAATADATLAIRSRLVVGADGRYTKTRKLADLPATITPAARDALWFKLPRPAQWGNVGRIMMEGGGSMIVLPTYPDLLRVGLSIPSGTFRQWRARGIGSFHARIEAMDAQLGALAREHVPDTAALSLLDIFTAQVPRWHRPGFVLIGDAAHTMSPILGQGVNQGILDAVHLAPLVFQALDAGRGVVGGRTLEEFQRQRQAHIRFVHDFQVRQEWMIGLGGWHADVLRSAFYRLVGHLPPMRSLLTRQLYYSDAIARKLEQAETAVFSKVAQAGGLHA